MLTMLREKKWIVLAFFVAIFLILLGFYHDKRTCCGSNDFDTYYFAGTLVVSGEDLYVHEAFRTTISPFLYLPFFAVLMAPLTFFHIRIASLAWYVLGLLSVGGSVFLVKRLVAGKEDIRRLLWKRPHMIIIASIVMLGVIWLDNVALAQIDFMIFFLIVLSLFAYEKKSGFVSGMILSVAAVIKIYPAYFLIYMAAKRRFAAIGGFLVGVVLLLFVVPFTVLGRGNFYDSMKSWREIRAAPYFETGGDKARENFARFEAKLKPKNQALSAVVTRYLIRDDVTVSTLKYEDYGYRIYWPHQLSPRQVDILEKILLFFIFIITFMNLDYRLVYPDRLFLSLEYSLIFLSMLLLFPMVKSHTFAPLLFPVMAYNYIKAKSESRSLYGARWMDIAFIVALVLYFLQGIEYMQVLGAGCLSLLVLWILFVGIIRKERSLRRPLRLAK
ncbi:MAG: glycosyltransferase family 87 protein [Candidatus Omnitrophota bacterium]|nr:glycosyltransferase family 87 protein [Candidatus Omnitrophota bacterium]